MYQKRGQETPGTRVQRRRRRMTSLFGELGKFFGVEPQEGRGEEEKRKGRDADIEEIFEHAAKVRKLCTGPGLMANKASGIVQPKGSAIAVGLGRMTRKMRTVRDSHGWLDAHALGAPSINLIVADDAVVCSCVHVCECV
jgi:hypothetical protein